MNEDTVLQIIVRIVATVAVITCGGWINLCRSRRKATNMCLPKIQTLFLLRHPIFL